MLADYFFHVTRKPLEMTHVPSWYFSIRVLDLSWKHGQPLSTYSVVLALSPPRTKILTAGKYSFTFMSLIARSSRCLISRHQKQRSRGGSKTGDPFSSAVMLKSIKHSDCCYKHKPLKSVMSSNRWKKSIKKQTRADKQVSCRRGRA